MINFTPEKKNTLFEALAQLKQITELLRSEEGCPWDRKQSNKDFALYLIDETYEYIDAINNKDFDNQKEELGDMYNNVLMLLTIHQEKKLKDNIELNKKKELYGSFFFAKLLTFLFFFKAKIQF